MLETPKARLRTVPERRTQPGFRLGYAAFRCAGGSAAAHAASASALTTVRRPSFEAGKRPVAISSRILVSPAPVAFEISATLKNSFGVFDVFIEASLH
jgi:hypothetical protein